MGKLTMLGLPVDPLQESWSPDGATIGAIAVQVVDDASAEPGDALAAAASRLSLTTSAVDAVWQLDPLAAERRHRGGPGRHLRGSHDGRPPRAG